MLQSALVRVPTEDLKRLLALLHRGELQCPLTPVEVTRCGFQVHMESLLGHLRGLEGPAVRAVLTAVLSERIAAQERMPRIV
ncbi:hypothetical protein [Nannocystis radixulma]|uniref:Uncharacterized protein n=1 Tax=Nannocystis radixulma TaxID=2995305 RepID=A0ABT5BET2_9BACT|nr:hypothetical protein [Nannocystis radixulma]MDC0671496.1 hypothetical protein [Nannocystis radixulma]